ncbi:MAG: Ig-like domain-containing protein [Dysgonamonadaceae bacterium]|jgi:hypothetical protein|nr:Ig-like domain-containing protein [Dysgonamonadaceae bacterium]
MKQIICAMIFCISFNLSLLAQPFSGGNGTESNPYKISSKADFEAMATANDSFTGKYFVLTRDLDDVITTIICNGYFNDGIPLYTGSFCGTFDGDGHYVVINNSRGLFGNIRDATIKNLIVKGNVQAKDLLNYVGGVCGFAYNSLIKNCVNFARIQNGNKGGICGGGWYATIINCYNVGNMITQASSNRYTATGGICGGARDTKIINAFNVSDSIKGLDPVGRVHTTGRVLGENDSNANGAIAPNVTGEIHNAYGLSSTILIGEDIISNPSDRHGKTEEITSFQSQNWLEYNMLYASGGTRETFDFSTEWKMTDINSDYKGLPILQNNSYPKQIAIGNQVGECYYGSANSLFYAVTTKNIINKTYTPICYGLPDGVIVSNIYLSEGSATMTVNTKANTPVGNYKIKIIFDDTESTFNLVVSNKTTTISVTSVSVTPTSKTMEIGETLQLTATVNPSNATNKNVSWSSSNSNVASVSSSGLVKAISSGTATITVKTTDGGYTAKSTITVMATPFLSVSPNSLNFDENGGTSTIAVTSNQNWTVSRSASWLTLSKTSGSNNSTFTVTAATNTGNTRNATVTVSGSGLSEIIEISQDAFIPSASSDNSLKSMNLSGGVSLTPSFNPNILTYTAQVPNEMEIITISAAANDSKSSIRGLGTHSLSVGSNTFAIVVTAENGSTRTYKITITRADVMNNVSEIANISPKIWSFAGNLCYSPAEPTLLSIYSLTGTLIFQQNVQREIVIPVGTGVYIVKIKANKENIIRKVFIN